MARAKGWARVGSSVEVDSEPGSRNAPRPCLGGLGARRPHGRSSQTDVARIVPDREIDGDGRGVMVLRVHPLSRRSENAIVRRDEGEAGCRGLSG